jgi:hypothetical protein
MRNIQDYIQQLKWSAFKRIELLFMFPERYGNTKARKDIRVAKRENREADNFIREYVRQAELYVKIMDLEEIPF